MSYRSGFYFMPDSPEAYRFLWVGGALFDLWMTYQRHARLRSLCYTYPNEDKGLRRYLQVVARCDRAMGIRPGGGA